MYKYNTKGLKAGLYFLFISGNKLGKLRSSTAEIKLQRKVTNA